MKNKLRQSFIIFSKYFMCIFYDINLLKGRHFNNNVTGWIWCWKNFYIQKIRRYNFSYPVPVSFRSEFTKFENITFEIDDLNNFQHFGCYFQAWNGKIVIGNGTYIAPNVGIITQNHDVYNLENHNTPKNVIIGANCWLGMNVVILPGVELGDRTIVGAGSVVTRSF